ncbi:hypothetical protein XENTR_v10000728 [Xenopus tropicalis]|nr:transmembrane protein 131-like [Xenopus tropicalis]KAE8630195.1 hypothetical protein XENTR_v10000728 [Xenopus tropicalis]
MCVRGSCKNYTDSFSSPDRGKGRGCLTVTAPQNRSQNASKRGRAPYSHSQKKHKCSVHYSVKQKSSSSTASSVATLCDASEQQTSDMPSATPKDSDCNEILNLNSTESRDTDNERHLSSPDSNLGKEEPAKQDPHLQQRTANESPLKEKPVLCMFPVETNLKTSESLSEPKLQPDFCDLPVPSKMSVSHLSKNLSNPQMESQTVSKKNEGNRQQTPPTSHREVLESTRKQAAKDASNEEISRSTSREEKLCGRNDALAAIKHEEPLREKSPIDERDGIFQNENWNKNRSSARKKEKEKQLFSCKVPPSPTPFKRISFCFLDFYCMTTWPHSSCDFLHLVVALLEYNLLLVLSPSHPTFFR